MYSTGNSEKAATYYDQVYRRGYNTRAYYSIYNETIKIIEKLNAPRVLEVGCGTGDLARLITGRGVPYRGFDFSGEGIACCKRSCPQGDFRVADAYDPESYLPHDYNIVVAIEVLEHLDDLKVIGHLPPGVRLIASVPDFSNIAHLRVYQDTQTDIIERFKPYVIVNGITRIVLRLKEQTAPLTFYLFAGITQPRRQGDGVAGCLAKAAAVPRRISSKVGRNDPCPCRSGK